MVEAANGRLEFEGMPKVLFDQVSVFNEEEVAQYPGTVLKVILSQLRNPKGEM